MVFVCFLVLANGLYYVTMKKRTFFAGYVGKQFILFLHWYQVCLAYARGFGVLEYI